MPDLIISAGTEGGYVVCERGTTQEYVDLGRRDWGPKILFAGDRVALISWLNDRLLANDRAVEQRHVTNFADVT